MRHNRTTVKTLVSCGTVGGNNSDIDVKIVDTFTGKEVSPNRCGEIWVRSPSRAAGYWNDPTKTLQTFCGILSTSENDTDYAQNLTSLTYNNQFYAHPKCYLKTGDIGFVYSGALYVCGRLKDMIVINGRNHYPQDIEITAEAVDGVRNGFTAVFGIQSITGGGEEMVLVAELNKDWGRSNSDDGLGFDAHRIIETIKSSVASFHGVILQAIYLIEPKSIPRTTSGKICRHRCKQLLASHKLPIVSSWLNPFDKTNDHTHQRREKVLVEGGANLFKGQQATYNISHMSKDDILIALVTEASAILDINTNIIETTGMKEPLKEFGIDSLRAIQFICLLEKKFGIHMPEEVFEENISLDNLSEIIINYGVLPPMPIAINLSRFLKKKCDTYKVGLRNKIHLSRVVPSIYQLVSRNSTASTCTTEDTIEDDVIEDFVKQSMTKGNRFGEAFASGSLIRDINMSQFDKYLAQVILVGFFGRYILFLLALLSCLLFVSCKTMIYLVVFFYTCYRGIGISKTSLLFYESYICKVLMDYFSVKLVLEAPLKRKTDHCIFIIGSRSCVNTSEQCFYSWLWKHLSQCVISNSSISQLIIFGEATGREGNETNIPVHRSIMSSLPLIHKERTSISKITSLLRLKKSIAVPVAVETVHLSNDGGIPEHKKNVSKLVQVAMQTGAKLVPCYHHAECEEPRTLPVIRVPGRMPVTMILGKAISIPYIEQASEEIVEEYTMEVMAQLERLPIKFKHSM